MSETASRRIATIPNLLSFLRILLIPAFYTLIVRPGTETAGLLLLALVVSTDWVDGYIARRTGTVTELGKLLDPLADRLAIAAALVAFLVRDAIPWWVAGLILFRDAIVLAAGIYLAATHGPRIEVRYLGKVATFTLMFAFPLIAWGNFGLFMAPVARSIGWIWFFVGIAEYYVAAGLYAVDLKRAGTRAQ